MIVAPPMQLREFFAIKKSQVDDLRTTQSRALNALNGLFASLQHRAFRGEL